MKINFVVYICIQIVCKMSCEGRVGQRKRRESIHHGHRRECVDVNLKGEETSISSRSPFLSNTSRN